MSDQGRDATRDAWREENDFEIVDVESVWNAAWAAASQHGFERALQAVEADADALYEKEPESPWRRKMYAKQERQDIRESVERVRQAAAREEGK